MDQVAIPHLKSLTSLKFVMRSEDGPYGGHIWRVLLREGVILQELTVDVVHEDLVKFFLSYSGLRQLHIVNFTRFDDAKDVAEMFFSLALPAHSDTLRSLKVEPVYEGHWCFSEYNAKTISECRKLSTLSVALQWENYFKVESSQPPLVSLFFSALTLV
jgi:hypothetical protein